jgi:hypothetical protein
MTNLADLDRALAEFLEGGPNTAPEAPVIAALAHARTTPRRPDPLAWFRPDVMAARPGRIVGLRPSVVLAVVALVVASIGIAVVGSRQQAPAVVVPGPSATPAQPSIAPSIAPSIGPAPFSRPVTMLVSAGDSYPIQVSDTTGDLIDARSLQPGDGASVGNDELQIVVDPADSQALILTWQGTPCEGNGSVDVDERSHNLLVRREQCAGDALPLDRVVRLQFASQVDPTVWSYTLLYAEFPHESAVPAGSSVP